jgi:hypothetical protein
MCDKRRKYSACDGETGRPKAKKRVRVSFSCFIKYTKGSCRSVERNELTGFEIGRRGG